MTTVATSNTNSEFLLPHASTWPLREKWAGTRAGSRGHTVNVTTAVTSTVPNAISSASHSEKERGTDAATAAVSASIRVPDRANEPFRRFPSAGSTSHTVTSKAMHTRIDNLEARSIEVSEYEAFYRTTCTAFGEEPKPTAMEAEKPSVEFDRTLAVFDRGLPVATTAMLTMDVVVPGGHRLPLGGLSWVGTMPGYTRRGLLTGLVQAQLQDMLQREEPVGGLWASESTIYGRFGFGVATWSIGLTLPRAHARLRLNTDSNTDSNPHSNADRSVGLLTTESALDILPPLYDRFARGDVGSLGRNEGWWRVHLADIEEHRDGGGPLYHAVHRDAKGNLDGYVSYRITVKWEKGYPGNSLEVVQLVAGSLETTCALWRHCFDLSLIETIMASSRPVDEPLRWMIHDARRLQITRLSDALWLRILDTVRCLEARSYATSGRLVLEVADSFGGFARGRDLLEADSGRAQVSRTRRSPDLRLDVATLSSAYLGGVSFSALAAAGRLEEVTSGAATRADALFAVPRAPYCSTDF